MTVKHGFFALGQIVTLAVFWQRMMGSINVSLAMAVLILGVVAGVVSAIINFMTMTAVVDRARLVAIVEAELMGLHDGIIARYLLHPAEYRAWRKGWR